MQKKFSVCLYDEKIKHNSKASATVEMTLHPVVAPVLERQEID